MKGSFETSMSQTSPVCSVETSRRPFNWKEKTGFSVRHLMPTDMTLVHEIEALVYEDPWSAELLLESLKAPLTYNIGAFLDEKVIGYAIFQVIFDEAHLLNLAVNPNFQSQGLGKVLLDEVVRRTRDAEARMLYLEVRPSNSVARALYEKNGFGSHSIREKYYPNGESALIMSRDLP